MITENKTVKGKLITFEGCEGVGKSTQIELLKKYFESNNIDALFLREPGGNKISEKIRDIILDKNNFEITDECEALLYCSARAQLIGQVIKPALESGKIVVCDRFSDSTFAYQGVARGLGVDYIAKLNEVTLNGVVPDVTFFLDLEPALAFKRKGGADENDRLEQQDIDFHNRVYKGYKLASEMYKDRIVTIDCTCSPKEVSDAIIDELMKRNIV